ncbi:MAG: VacJ family lipoprotein [Pigmentiphaga sp.]
MKLISTRSLLPLVVALLAAGCATVPGEPDPRDPLEPMNRTIYRVNSELDEHVFIHVVHAYRDIVPPPVRSCVRNMFGNLRDVWSAANSFMQLRVPDGINTVGRVLMNSSLGVLGCFDPASEVGVARINNDFGTTLGVWGVGAGPYLVLPLLGPSTARDGVGMVADFYGNVLTYSDNIRLKNTLRGISLIDQRANLVGTLELVDQLALDPYTFVRDAYLQRRMIQIRGRDAEFDLPDYSLPDYEDEEATLAPTAVPAAAAP